MSVVYLEDIIKVVGNKYLAIDIASQRARQLNEQGVPMTGGFPRKVASLVVEELVEGKIGYNRHPLENTPDSLSSFHYSADESERAKVLGDLLPTPVYVDNRNIGGRMKVKSNRREA